MRNCEFVNGGLQGQVLSDQDGDFAVDNVAFRNASDDAISMTIQGSLSHSDILIDDPVDVCIEVKLSVEDLDVSLSNIYINDSNDGIRLESDDGNPLRATFMDNIVVRDSNSD